MGSARTPLKPEEVDAIRTARSDGQSATAVAKRFEVHRGTVWVKRDDVCRTSTNRRSAVRHGLPALTASVIDMTEHPPATPYGSARDLPSVRELEQQMAAYRLLGFLLPRDQPKELKRLQKEHRRITDTVDAFYTLLGPRNWVFTGDLNLETIAEIISAQDPEVAERRLIEYYQTQDRIAFPLRRLNRFDEMRPRIPLLQKALVDYEAGRFYSTVLVLLSVMDGFVNDLDTAQRKGLHARSPEDMVAWDSVVGHHLGLSHAHQSFIKSHYKLSVDETTELARNGIMHGTLVNYDSEVVATKAWNRLFAVADWADSRRRQAAPVEPDPTFHEALARWRQLQADKTRLDQWESLELRRLGRTLQRRTTDILAYFARQAPATDPPKPSAAASNTSTAPHSGSET